MSPLASEGGAAVSLQQQLACFWGLVELKEPANSGSYCVICSWAASLCPSCWHAASQAMQPCRPSGKFACYSTASQACNPDPAARYRCFHPAAASPTLARGSSRLLAQHNVAGCVTLHLTSWHPAKYPAACVTPHQRHCSCRGVHSAGLVTGTRSRCGLRPARW